MNTTEKNKDELAQETNLNVKKEEYQETNITQDHDEVIIKKHEDANIHYPKWNPANVGDNLDMYIDSVTVLKDFNGHHKHMVLMVAKTRIKEVPMVSFFPNKVCLTIFEKMTADKSFGNTYEDFRAALQTLIGRTFNVMYQGLKPSSKKGFQDYKSYSIIEL